MKLGLSREYVCRYFRRGDNVCRRINRADMLSYAKSEVVISGLDIDKAYWYFIDEDGDISRSRRPKTTVSS